jgi:hypothetical protein
VPRLLHRIVDGLLKRLSFGFACRIGLCNLGLRRPHWTCMHCDSRKAYYGRGYHDRIRVSTYVLYIDENRRFAVLKAVLLKKLLSVCEGLAV